MATSDVDAIVIGAGHNGLVCAAYLAQAGQRVLVVEGHDAPGGCIASVELPGFPGSHADIGGLEQGAFAGSAALRELALERHGLHYLRRDHIYTFATAGPAWLIHRDQEQSIRSIERFSRRDAAAYARFSDLSAAILQLLGTVGSAPPPSLADLATLAGAAGHRIDPIMQTILASPRQVVDSWFESDGVRAGLLNQASHAQTPPWQLGSGYAPCLALGGQGHGGARPQGGGRSLIQALVSCLEAHGGALICGRAVRRVVVRKRRAVGVELDGGEQITARRAVIAAIDARRVFTRLLDEETAPPAIVRAVSHLTSARDNIGELSMACVLGTQPLLEDVAARPDGASGLIWQSGGVADVEASFMAIRQGKLPERPCIMWAVPSILDPSLAPEGMHTLWLAAFLPYAFADGSSWDARKEEVADYLPAQLGSVAPNLPSSVRSRVVYSPVDWERRTGNLCGNADHLDTSIDQMLGNRPIPPLARYRTPIHGLYLTGAGTHPGGGITGNPGRNTAHVVMRDLGVLQRDRVHEMRVAVARLRDLAGAVRVLRRYL